MTEEATIAALTDLGELALTFMGMWFSLTFAYLTVAYLVGRTLSPFQCSAISALYVVGSAIFGASGIGYSDAWLQLRERESSIIDNVWVFTKLQGYLEGAIIIVVAGTVVSLYFMYDTRRGREN